MSDNTLLPIHRDVDGVDRPFMGDAVSRSRQVDALISGRTRVLDGHPNINAGDLLSSTVGLWPLLTLGLFLAMRFSPGSSDVVRAVGGLGVWLAPPLVTAVVGIRRTRAMPADLQMVLRQEIRDSLTAVRVRPWVVWSTFVALALLLLLLRVSA